MAGTVTVSGHTYTGTALNPLLTGHILQFGSQYNPGTSTAQFDYRFELTGGLFTGAGPLQSSFAGQDIGVTMTSEHSNTFTGSFQTDFNGGAKGNVGPIAPLPVALYGYKFNDLNDNGADNSEPRLANWTINLTGTDDLGNPVSASTVTVANGGYSFTGLVPGTYTVTEVQQNGWTQTTGGTTVTLTSGQVAVALSGEAGMLPPGGMQVVTPLLAFGNFNPKAIVIGMDKSPATPQSFNVFDPISGNSKLSAPVVPYGNTFQGGVRVATGDLNANGFDDIVTAPGRGASPPVVNVYDQFGNLLTSFAAYPPSVNGGLQVAVADLNGDGVQDIVTLPSWGPAEVRVFYNMGAIGGAPVFSTTPSLDFLAFPSSFIGGAVVAASSEGTMSNGLPQIIVGSGAGMAATVEVFNANSVGSTPPAILATPAATFKPFSTLTPPLQGGVSLAVAQLTSVPNQSIVVGAGTGGQSLVNIWGWNGSSYAALSASGVAGFPAFPGTSSNAPVQVATINDPNGVTSAIVAVQGAGATATNVHQLNITSIAPLVLSSPIVSPVPFSGPSTIAVINNVQPQIVPQPVPKPAAAATTTAKPAATAPALTATTAAAATAKPATTTTTTTVVTTAKPAATTTTTTAATTKPITTTAVTAAKPATTTATVAATTAKTATTAAVSSAAAIVTTTTKSTTATTVATNAQLAAYVVATTKK